MSSDVSQAKRYREMVRTTLWRYTSPPNSNPDTALRIHLESLYEEGKNKISCLVNENASDSIIRREKVGLFVISVGLFTFGQLDVAEDILSGIPGGKGSIRRFTWVLKVLLPLPKELDVLEQPDVVNEWLKLKRSKLRWDGSSEKYILENFRILSGNDGNSNLENFSATDNEVDQEGLVVEIIPDLNIRWLANFKHGHSEFSGGYQHPNRIHLIIISKRQGYVINPESRELLEVFGGKILNVIDAPILYSTLFVNGSHILCYDSSGLLWKNIEISWNNIHKIKLEGAIMTGEFFSNEESWMPFWLNIKTGEFHREEFNIEYSLRKNTKRLWWQFW
ncbi:MAG: hypothetical protein AAF349_20310 [Cyanobacteria bacterium P01_A01_bin.68]